MRQTLAEQIAVTRRSLAAAKAKPRSRLCMKLELRLCDLVTRKIKQELRAA